MSCCPKKCGNSATVNNNINPVFIVLILFILLAIIMGGVGY